MRWWYCYTLQRKEREKEQHFLEQAGEIRHHRKEAMAEKEHRQQEQAKQDQELLVQRVIQDQKVGCTCTYSR